MNSIQQARLQKLYRKTGGGHILLEREEYTEYAALRKQEYTEFRDDILARGGKCNAVKDDAGDIIGFQYSVPETV